MSKYFIFIFYSAYKNIRYKEWSSRLGYFAKQHEKGKFSQIGIK